MSNVLARLYYAAVEIWKKLGVPQRASIILIAIVTVAAIGTVLTLSTRPDWAVVYADLDSATAARVYELAGEQGVPVKLADGGRTILVPSRHVNPLRLETSRAGIAVDRHAGRGFEIFDKSGKMPMTTDGRMIAYQRAVQGELQQMIGEMPGIERVTVLLSMPRKRPFYRGEEAHATASVMVVMAPGRQLSGSQVHSIRYLVSTAVESMTPQDVTITDNSGRIVARGKDEDSWGMDNGTRFETRRQFEEALRDKAEQILRPIVGAGNVVAVVNVELDWDERDTVIETVDRANAAPVSERIVEEESETSEPGAEGVAGTGSNMTVSVQDPEPQAEKARSRTHTSKITEAEYIYPRTTEKVRKKPGHIKSLSVAVTVARQAEGPRSAEDIEALRKLVVSAVGALNDEEAGRQDTVEVVESGFVVPVAAPVTSSVLETLSHWTHRLGGLATAKTLFGAALLFVLYRVFRRQFGREQVDRADLEAGIFFDEEEALPAPAEPRRLEPPTNTDDPEALVKHAAQTNPADVGRTMESWLRQES